MFNKMSGPSNSSDINSSDAASTEVDAGVSQGAGLAENLNGENTVDIKTKIRNLKDDETLTLTQHNIPDFPYLKIKKNPKFDNMFILWNENTDGEVINKVNFSSFNNTIYWAEKCDEMSGSQQKGVNESMNADAKSKFDYDEEVELEYKDLPLTITEEESSTGYFDTEYGNWLPSRVEERDLEVDYIYKVSKKDVLEVISEIVFNDPDYSATIDSLTDGEFESYLEENFDGLFEKYQSQVKDYFRDRAIEDAYNSIDFNDYLYDEGFKSEDYFEKKFRDVEDVELKNFWDDVKDIPEVEEDYTPVDTNLELEGIDSVDPEVRFTDYDWTEEDPEETQTEWEEVASKNVFDSDGFLTDYVWYTNGDKHVFVFGDSDIYKPEDGDFDWEIDIVRGKEAEAYKEAQDWFNSYKGFEDEDLDLEVADFKDPIPEDAYEYNDTVDQDSYFDDEPITEAAMSDLDLDIKEIGGTSKLISKIEKHVAALRSELDFLRTIAPREIGSGGNFDSKKEIEEAKEATEKELSKELAKLSVLRGKN